MLTALLNGNKIYATDPNWADRKEEYRALCDSQALCPICKENIRCKFGPIKQHHFAHRLNSDCPGDHDTEEHMLGKAILYEFLKTKYGDKAKIEIEPYFEEINLTGDILVEFNDGSRWAVEFQCNAKEKDLQKKIDYYEDNNIITTWMISSRLSEELDDKTVRIARREQPFIKNMGIDRLYIGDWYEQIVIHKQRIPLPTHSKSEGSLMAFDVETRLLTIVRALRPTNHRNIFYYGALLRGSLEDVIIKPKNSWGIIFYFKQEEELWPKFKAAQQLLEMLELELEHQAAKKARDEAEAKYRDSIILGRASNNSNYRRTRHTFNEIRPGEATETWYIDDKEFAVPPGSAKRNNMWGTDEEAKPRLYRCIDCQQEYGSGAMVSIFHYNRPEGVCRKCNAKREELKRTQKTKTLDELEK